MLVHSLWDQEDIYGDIARVQGAEAEGYDNRQPLSGDRPLVSSSADGWTAAPSVQSASAATPPVFPPQRCLRPFLDHYLKDDAPPLALAAVNAFETGANDWQALPRWPMGCASGCAPKPVPLYLHAGGGLGFGHRRPAARASMITCPIRRSRCRTCRARSTRRVRAPYTWQNWLVSDQREAPAARTCSLYLDCAAEEPLKIGRRTDRQSDRLHQRNGRRFCREADRRLSG